jgi:DNA-binding XRE family transcriptional regulator
MAIIGELKGQGMPADEAVRKAVEAILGGSPNQLTIKSLARSLVEEQGLTPGAATVQAARTMGDVLVNQRRRKLAAEGRLTKSGPDQAEADVAAEIRVARITKGLTQEDLATEVGVSVQTIRSWEAGHLPDGLNITKVAGVLGGGMDMARRIAAARGRT